MNHVGYHMTHSERIYLQRSQSFIQMYDICELKQRASAMTMKRFQSRRHSQELGKILKSIHNIEHRITTLEINTLRKQKEMALFQLQELHYDELINSMIYQKQTKLPKLKKCKTMSKLPQKKAKQKRVKETEKSMKERYCPLPRLNKSKSTTKPSRNYKKVRNDGNYRKQVIRQTNKSRDLLKKMQVEQKIKKIKQRRVTIRVKQNMRLQQQTRQYESESDFMQKSLIDKGILFKDIQSKEGPVVVNRLQSTKKKKTKGLNQKPLILPKALKKRKQPHAKKDKVTKNNEEAKKIENNSFSVKKCNDRSNMATIKMKENAPRTPKKNFKRRRKIKIILPMIS